MKATHTLYLLFITLLCVAGFTACDDWGSDDMIWDFAPNTRCNRSHSSSPSAWWKSSLCFRPRPKAQNISASILSGYFVPEIPKL